MSLSSEHIHRKKLNMHAGQFFVGMKLTQNRFHGLDKNEPPGVNSFKA